MEVEGEFFNFVVSFHFIIPFLLPNSKHQNKFKLFLPIQNMNIKTIYIQYTNSDNKNFVVKRQTIIQELQSYDFIRKNYQYSKCTLKFTRKIIKCSLCWYGKLG